MSEKLDISSWTIFVNLFRSSSFWNLSPFMDTGIYVIHFKNHILVCTLTFTVSFTPYLLIVYHSFYWSLEAVMFLRKLIIDAHMTLKT